MFNINNVINTPVLNDPWKHQIIDNFFSNDQFDKLSTAAKALELAYTGKVVSADDCLSLAEVFEIIGEEVFDIILEANRSLLDNIELITTNFPNHRQFKEYISFPSFHILPPNTPWQAIHDEAEDKTVSIVVYLCPAVSIGTTLYKSNNRDSEFKEVPWRPNTGMLFCGEEGVTWHDFCSKENPRVTLNFFLRTIKDRKLVEQENNYVWEFSNGLKTYIPKTLSKSKLEILTGEELFRTL
jgi:hypothetical protein